MDFIHAGGIMMYLLLAIALGVAVLAVRSWLRLRRGPADAVVETTIDAILFWSAYGVILGLLGTLVGLAQAAQAVERAGAVEVTLIWGGVKVALIPTIFSLVIFSIAFIIWFALRMRYRRLAVG